DRLAMQKANSWMKEFRSTLSHEFRTPLTSVSGYVQLLIARLRKALPDDAEEEKGRKTPEDPAGNAVTVGTVAERLKYSLDQLERLVDDRLEESCIQSGRLEFRLVSCDLSAIVRAAVEKQRLLAGSRAIQFEPLDDARPVPVTADASHIEQVVTNYL